MMDPSNSFSFSVWRIHPLQFKLLVRERRLVVEAVALPLLIRNVHGDRTTSEEHPHIAILWRKRERDEERWNILWRESSRETHSQFQKCEEAGEGETIHLVQYRWRISGKVDTVSSKTCKVVELLTVIVFRCVHASVCWFFVNVSPLMNCHLVQGVLHLSPNVSWDSSPPPRPFID